MTERIALADLREQHLRLGPELDAAMRRVMASGRFVLGPEVEAFEAAAARYLGAPHAVGVSSGTDAVLLSLMALGVGPGDEVVTTPFTFIASAECIARLGARPVFADVDPGTLCLDPAQARAAVTARTRALLPVHLYGAPADMEAIMELGSARGVPVVEDAAQAFATGQVARRAGTWGAFGCFSFFPAKVLGAAGDGGLVVARDAENAARVRRLRQHGARSRERHEELGGNHRLDALQAAVLGVKLAHLDRAIARRRAHAAEYDAGLSGIDGLDEIRRGEGWNGAVYALRVRDDRRDALRASLERRGVETAVYYPRPLHLEPVFASLGYGAGALPVSERAAREVLALPVHAELPPDGVARVIDAVRTFFR